MSLLAVLASSGSVYAQTTTDFGTLPGAVEMAPSSGSYDFKVRGETQSYTMCTYEMCRRDQNGQLKVMPVAAGSTAAVIAQAADPNAENFIVFYPKGREGVPSARRILRNRYMIELKEGADLNAIKSRCGMKTITRMSEQSRFAVCEEVSASKVLSQVQEVAADPDILSAEPLFAKKLYRRALPNDPYVRIYDLVDNPDGYPDERTYQWYLSNLGFNGASPGIDLNVEPANLVETGAGVVVSIVDDGVAIDHPELAGAALGGDQHLNLVDDSRFPATFDIYSNHGTNVAGLLAAAADGAGMAGVAPGVDITAVRLLGGFVDDADEATALLWGMAPIPNFSSPFGPPINPGTQDVPVVDISTNSWGPDDSVLNFDRPSAAVLEAIELGVLGPDVPNPNQARGGLGGIFVWAAGNGGEINDNSNYDGFANSIYTIAVGAVNDAGRRALYSEPGANIVVCAPSDGGAQSLLTTAFDVGLDLDGNPVRIPTYVTDFGGTSAATPLVSGVVAMMLEANDQLTWRDVQDILIRTAVQNDPLSGGWITNGANLNFNHDYGAGLVDAAAAVQAARDRGTGNTIPDEDPRLPVNEFLAENVQPLSKSFFFNRGNTDPSQQTGFIPDFDPNAPQSYNLSFDFSNEENIDVEHVELNMTALTQNRSDLEVVLISPSGTQSLLHVSDTNHKEQGISDWTFTTLRNWGEDSAGTWILRITDKISGNEAILNDATVTLHGTSDPDGGVSGSAVLVSEQLVDVNQYETVAYQIEAVGATEIAVGDLPEGLSFNADTSLISGAANVAGFYQVPIFLTGEDGTISNPTISIVVRPVEEALGDALGLPGYDVVTSRNFPWAFEFIDTNDGNVSDDQKVAARSSLGLGDNQQSFFGFNGIPQGVLTFDWKTSSEEGYDRLWFNYGGAVPQNWSSFISGERDWGTVSVMLPEPINNVRWIYGKDAVKGTDNEFSGEDRGLLDNIRWQTTAKYLEELKEYGGISGFDLEIDSRTLWRAVPWPPVPNPPFKRIMSSSVGNGQSVSLAGWLDGPGTLNIVAENYAEEGDLFEILLDGVVINENQAGSGPGVGPPNNIVLQDFAISAGRHRLQVRHRKDFRGTSGRSVVGNIIDGVLISRLEFVPEESFQALASSLGIDGLLPEGDADGDGYSNHEEYAFGGDLLVADIPKNIPRLISKDGRNYIEYGIDTSKGDLNYAPQQSTNMSEWVDAQLTTLDRVEGDIEYYQIPVLSLPGRKHLFYRVVATPK